MPLRRHYHEQVAKLLEAQFPDSVETQPELLAQHYTEAGLIWQAIPYWQEAGERARQRSAHAEAMRHLTRGLELLKTLQDTPERTQHELTIQIALGLVLLAAKGQGAAEVRHAFARARELCQQVRETPQLFSVLLGLRRYYFERAELQAAHELDTQLLTLAQHVQDSELLLEAHRVQGSTLYCLGAFVPARTHLAQCLALYDFQQHRSHAMQQGIDPGAACLSWESLVLWMLGYPAQALQSSRAALALAQELAHPYSLAMVHVFAAWLHQLRREVWATQERAEAAAVLASAQEFPPWLWRGTILRGWALSMQGQGEEGITQIRQGMAMRQVMGGGLQQSHYLTLLAEAYGQVQQSSAGLRMLAEALTIMDSTQECFYAAELHRLKGELLLRQAAPDNFQAESCCQQALTVARHQQAKSLELHAAMNLARLWQQQGKRAEARQLLGEVYDWFTEGFETADLQEAQALLDAWA